MFEDIIEGIGKVFLVIFVIWIIFPIHLFLEDRKDSDDDDDNKPEWE